MPYHRSAVNSEFYPLPGMTGVCAGGSQKTSWPAAGPYTVGIFDVRKVAKVGVFLNITGVTGAAEPIIHLVGFSAAPTPAGLLTLYYNTWEGSLSAWQMSRNLASVDRTARWFSVPAPYIAVRLTMGHQGAAIKIGLGRGASIVFQGKRGLG